MKKPVHEALSLPLGILLAVSLSLFPFLWFVVTSLKSRPHLEAIPPTWLPDWNLQFYQKILVDRQFLLFIKNSVIVAGSTTILASLIGIPAAYALVRLRWRAKNAILVGLLMVSMFPQVVIAGPVWRLLSDVGGVNTYWGVTIPYLALTLPLTIWILATFFKELPLELEEAARLDGCTTLQILLHLFIPLSCPGIFTAAILTFIYAWNEFFFALLLLTDPARQTLPVGIALFQGEFTMPWGELAAASVVATLPLILMTLVFQKRIIRGLSAGAVKG